MSTFTHTWSVSVCSAKLYACHALPSSPRRYSRKLVVGDLYRLPEVVAVREQGGSRLVCLLPSSLIRQSPLGSSQSQEGSSSTSGSPVVFEELEYHEPVCRQHYTQQDFRLGLEFSIKCTWYKWFIPQTCVIQDAELHASPHPTIHGFIFIFSEADFDPDSYKIPFVVMSLSTLASEVHSLLQSHEGTLPLLRWQTAPHFYSSFVFSFIKRSMFSHSMKSMMWCIFLFSFPECYAAKFSPLQLGNETLEGGVSLEHLITCVPSITIVTAQNGFKVIKWIHNKPPAPNSGRNF